MRSIRASGDSVEVDIMINDKVAYVRYVIWLGASDGPVLVLELAPRARMGGSGRKLQAVAGR